MQTKALESAAVIETPEQLYIAHRKAFFRKAAEITRNFEDAEDCVQEAFLKIFQHWSDCKPETCVAWAYTIVVNQCRDLLRKKRARKQERHVAIEDIQPDTIPATPSPERQVTAKLIMVRGLEHLSPKEQSALMTWAHGNLPTEKSSVKVRAYRARLIIRKCLTSSVGSGTKPRN